MRDISSKYELVLNVNGRPVREYSHDGLVFIEGRPGSEYSLTIKNNSHERIAAIVSVDGLGVVDGNPAGIESSSFIIAPYSSQTVDGWVKSLNAVNKFEFSSVERSYSNRTSNGTKNVGVIGLMVFAEKYQAPTHINRGFTPFFDTTQPKGLYPTSTCVGPEGIASMNSMSVGSVGTGYGEEKKVNLSKVNFVRRDPNNPDAIIAMYYDERKGLERRGIVLDPKNEFPNAFPTYVSDNSFCKTPSK